LCHLGFFNKVCFFFFLFFSRLEMHFFLLLLLCFFLCVFQKLFFFIFFSLSLLYKRCAKHVRPSVPPHTHNTYLCVLVLRLRFRAQKAAFGRDDDEREEEEEEGADLAFFLF
jgi:hypothetical protein